MFLSPRRRFRSVKPSIPTISNGRTGRQRPSARISFAATTGLTQLAGSIARSPFFAGEPVRDAKLVKETGSGFMAAILPTGIPAISTEISPETGGGDLILPHDRADVIFSNREMSFATAF